MKKQRILLAEDHTILREGLRSLFAGEPDLVLMDLSMPRMNGTEAISAIKRRLPEIKIITLTNHKAQEYVRAALDAGADGYVLKDDSRQELLTAIRSVATGHSYLSPGICTQVVSGFLGRAASPSSATTWDTLTEREREVIKLVAEGYKNREIAECLSVSIKTVEKHRSNLMRKLDLHSASALTTYAIENGLVGR